MPEKFTKRDLEKAADQLALLPYFPVDGRPAIMLELGKMMPHKEALEWAIKQVTSRCKQWPSLAEIRGLLCTRYDAADGIYNPSCSIPGHTVEEREMHFLDGERKRLGLDLPICDSSRKMLRDAVKRLEPGPYCTHPTQTEDDYCATCGAALDREEKAQ